MSILPHPNRRMDWINEMKSETEFSGLKWILPVVIGLTMFSCGKEDRPAEIMSQPEMVSTMMEIYIAEEKANRLGISQDTASKVFDSLKVRLFERLSVKDTVFKSSLLYYTDHPKEMEEIMTALVDSLQLREQKAPGQHAP
jgi:hypothetical protein